MILSKRGLQHKRPSIAPSVGAGGDYVPPAPVCENHYGVTVNSVLSITSLAVALMLAVLVVVLELVTVNVPVAAACTIVTAHSILCFTLSGRHMV